MWGDDKISQQELEELLKSVTIYITEEGSTSIHTEKLKSLNDKISYMANAGIHINIYIILL
jgi:hypothetical protein